MKENIENYQMAGFIDLDEYLQNNPDGKIYPYYINGYDEKNFWIKIGKDGEEKYIYVKPRENFEEETMNNVYSELIYEELMKQVGIKSADFNIALYDNLPATISSNILDNYDSNQFILNASDFLDTTLADNFDCYSIEDLYEKIHEYCYEQSLSDEVEKKCIDDINKVCIADIFALSTQMSVTDFDFIAGIDANGNETLELAPLCHNTYSLGSTFTDDEIADMIEYDELLERNVSGCCYDIRYPDYEYDYEYPYWEDDLEYFIGQSDEYVEFAKECASNMNIDQAISNVEEKIYANIPEEYHEFLKLAFESRIKNICETLGIDYCEKAVNEELLYDEEVR